MNLTEPSRHGPQGHDAFEIKFLLPDSAANEILARVRSRLAADPYADPAFGDGYRISSLYFDTADLSVYHRVGSFGRRKFRLRRYGSEPRVFLERKSKSQGLVRKRRTAVPESELGRLNGNHTGGLHHPAGRHNEPNTSADSWPGHWFHRRLARRRLAPKTQVSYERIARVGMTPEGFVRFTVDRQVRCTAAAGLDVPYLVDGPTILAGWSIVEFKFRIAMPVLFKELMHEFSLTPTSVSKYRLSVDACGLNGSPPGPASHEPSQAPARRPAACG